MPEFERDLLMRQIRQLGDLVAAIVARARADERYENGLEAIRHAAEHGFGPDRALIDRLGPRSAAMLLRDAEAVRVYAGVCAAEAGLLAALGRHAEAAALEARVASVEEAAREMERERGG